MNNIQQSHRPSPLEQTFDPLEDQVTTDTCSLLNVKGRINRLTYLAWHGVKMIVFFLIGAIIYNLVPNIFLLIMDLSKNWLFLLISLALYGLYIYFNFIFAIKRLHDINYTACLSLLILVPGLSPLFLLFLACMPGNKEVNIFGVPRRSSSWEVFLGWLTILLNCILVAIMIKIILEP